MKQYSFFGHDYRYRYPALSERRIRFSRNHLLLMLGIGLGIGGAITFIPDDAAATRGKVSFTEPTPESVTQQLSLPQTPTEETPQTSIAPLPPQIDKETPSSAKPLVKAPSTPLAAKPVPENTIKWQSINVRKGDNLAAIFARVNLSPRELHNVITLNKNTKKLTRIFPGDTLDFQIDNEKLQQLRYELDDTRTLFVHRDGDSFKSEIVSVELDRQFAYASGTITSSLFLAAQKAGLSDRLTMELAGIFGWDVDFVLDIREGDTFAVVYEHLYRNGEKLKEGDIVAAEFTNRGRTVRAVRYENNEGRADYFTPEGHSMRKTFLRTPVDFTRISSKFSLGRKHPVLNRIRAHKGVDYAAPTGTPVKVTGDGKIVFRGRKGGYGKVVIVQHGSKYSTLYAHLSNYARGKRSGTRVSQGQVIGYVGKTGLATGPHLHYELRVNGVHRNPLTVKFPNAQPLPKQYMADFQVHAGQLLAQLDRFKQTQQVALR